MVKSLWLKCSILSIFLILLNPLTTSLVHLETQTVIFYQENNGIKNVREWYIDKKNFTNIFKSYINESNQYDISLLYEHNQNVIIFGGLMNSSWPMLSYDQRHTGFSQYSTIGNPGAEIWRIHGDQAGAVESSAVVDQEGVIYFGTIGGDSSLYALYPNGTRKWKYHANGLIWSTSAIAEDGTIYLPSWGSHLVALHPNGQVKWDISVQDPIASSVTIAEDGTIYLGTMAGNLYAINSNGTERWHRYLGGNLISSPAIGYDNIIFIGTTSNYLYAVNPNGTLRWKFGAGQFKGSPSIADDGTIYAPCFNGYLYAFYSNGTVKWQASTGGSVAGAGVALGVDGTIYVGTEQLRAFYPNGTLKWMTDVHGSIYGTVPAVSADGTIYVSAGSSLVAVNPDGIEQWRKSLSNEQIRSSPSIGNNGRVYIGSTYSDYGYLHAFGLGPLRAEAYGPYHSTMTEPLQFTGEAFGGTPPYISYHWDFGDGNTSNEPKPTHIYAHRGNYTSILTVTDSTGNQSNDTTQVKIGYPLPKITIIKPVNALYIFNIKILPWPYPVVFGPLVIKAEASQLEIGIDRVEFYDEGTLIKTDYTQPYDCLWRAHPPPILHSIMVRVYDVKGNQNGVTIYPNKWF